MGHLNSMMPAASVQPGTLERKWERTTSGKLPFT